MIFLLAKHKKCILTLIVFLIGFFIFANFIKKQIPNTFAIENYDDEINLNNICFLNIKIKSKFNKNVLASEIQKTNLKAKAKIFNCVPIKNINLEVKSKAQVIPCGIPFGIKIFTEGVMVVDVLEKLNEKIKQGDIITKINHQPISSAEEFTKFIQSSQGKILDIEIKRKNEFIHVDLQPFKEKNEYQAGLWVMEGSGGLGIMTFILHKTNIFTGLGHGVKNKEGNILPIREGKIYQVLISSIKKSTKNNVGELKGSIINNGAIGKLKTNQEDGVYGYIENSNFWLKNSKIMKVAFKQEVENGEAEIILSTDGNSSPKNYKICIENIKYGESKNIHIKIKDKRLLENGGILQGMSGSPIVQNNQLVGVLTHVITTDPTQGFGNFAEDLAMNCEKIL